jgi:sulfide:quinone oxidoreductase
METREISKALSVSAQITAQDIPALKDRGFRSIICNRPDGEGADQPAFEEIRAAAEAAGIEARYIPIKSGVVGDDDAAAFGAALRELPNPVLAYCRTGTRSATLWSLSQANTLSVADILASTKAAGYDMAGVVRRTHRKRRQGPH